jgi:hypothetical protein
VGKLMFGELDMVREGQQSHSLERSRSIEMKDVGESLTCQLVRVTERDGVSRAARARSS